jgi:small subunit ribosomal protein S8
MNNNLINFLIKIKNGSTINKEIITVDYDILSLKILKILYREGLIQSFKIDSTKIHIFLRYINNRGLFDYFKIISKVSNVVYLKYTDICKLSDKRFLLVLSTNKGLLTGLECKKYKLGGELLFIC